MSKARATAVTAAVQQVFRAKPLFNQHCNSTTAETAELHNQSVTYQKSNICIPYTENRNAAVSCFGCFAVSPKRAWQSSGLNKTLPLEKGPAGARGRAINARHQLCTPFPDKFAHAFKCLQAMYREWSVADIPAKGLQ